VRGPRPLARLLRRAPRRCRDVPLRDDGEPAFVALTFGQGSEIGLGGIAAEPLHGRPQRPAAGHRVELCVYVEDVDATFAAAGLAGFETVTPPADMPWGERVAWLADPDGNLVMLTR
jgi:lactoylglutathione lyase